MGKGERWGSRINGVTGIGTSTGVIKKERYYYRMWTEI